MGRFLRRKHVTEEQPEEQSFWQVPARFNFSRDVVEAYAADPLRPALTFVDRDGVIDRLTFADIAIDAGRWAGLLRSRGLEPGDRVLIVVGLNRTWHGVMLGALKAGVVAIPCPASLDVAEIHRRARDAEARVAVVEADRASEVWQSDAPLTIVVVDEVEPELREIPPIQPTHDTAAEDEALILYTSGTTGAPKGTILTHASTWAARVPAEHWLDARTGDLVWCTVGTSWALSIWSILFYPWSRGAESVLHDAEFDPEQRFDLLQRLGVTVLCQSPTEYRLLTEAPWISRFDLGRLRHAVSSGERLELETITAFRKVFDVTIHDGYGQAENALLVANTRGTAVKPGSMGLPLPGHQVAVVDAAGTELPADAEGDLVLRGRPPTLFAGYIEGEGTAETADAFREDWYLTGDRVTRDADGYLWFTGRGAPLREVAADRARAVEAREAEILALENAHVDDVAVGESAQLDNAVGRKKRRAAADAKRAEAEAAARAERRADLERRTAEALAVDEVRREDERRAAEAEAEAATETAERARLEAETAERERLEQERRDAEAALIEERARRQAQADAEAAERARLEAEAAATATARLEAEAAQREQERRDAEAALIEERARRQAQADAEAAEQARLEAEAAATATARLEAEAAQREQERRDAEAALIEERARRQAQADAEAAEQARLEAEAAATAAARLEAEAAQREQERLDAEAALAEEHARREQEEAEARAVAAATTVATADVAPSATPALSGRAARKEQQRIRKEEERARKDEERRRKEEERARKDEERKQQEEERAAAERRKREEAEEQKAASERAKQAEQRRKEEEKRQRDEEKAAQEIERREAEARQREARAAAETQRAEEARQKAAEEERRKEEERRRKAAEKERREAERQRKPPSPGETVAEPGDESLDEDRPNAELIARLRAYGLRQPDDGVDE